MKFPSSTLSRRRLSLRLVSWAVIIIVFMFFVVKLQESWHSVDKQEILDYAPTLLFAGLFFIVAVCASGALWGAVLSTIGDKKVYWLEAIRVHLSSWLLKYIPGQVGSVANKITWAQKNRYSKRDTTRSFIYENVFTLIASLILAVPLLGLAMVRGGDVATYAALSIAGLVLAFIVASPLVLDRAVNFALRLAKKEQIGSGVRLGWIDLVKFASLYLVPRVLTGLGFATIALIYMDVTPYGILISSSAYIFASAVGLVAIFVPSGLGVREAVIVFFMAPLIGIEESIILAILARFVSTAADLGILALYSLLTIKGKK